MAYRSPFVRYGLWLLGISAVLTAAGVYGLGLGWFWAYLLSINLTVFAFYGVDKWKAGRGSFRIPENVLHAGGLIGGSPGAYAAMRAFRHKTIKGRFRLIFWIMVAIQGALLVYLPLRWFGVL